MRRRWPQLLVDSSAIGHFFRVYHKIALSLGFYEPEAGLIDAQMANSCHRQRAQARGAHIVTNTKVTNVEV